MNEEPQPRHQAPWGARGALLGLVLAFSILILTALVISAGGQLFDLDQDSVVLRYVFIAAFQLILAGVPLGTVLAMGGRWDLVGLRPISSWALLESIGLGVVISGLTAAYHLGLWTFLPAGFEAFIKEQENQGALMEGPITLLLFSALILAPFCEELFFRAYFFAGLREHLNFAFASGITAALFTLIHGMPWASPPLFLVGLGAAVLYERHRALPAAMAMHASFNGCELIVAWLDLLPVA